MSKTYILQKMMTLQKSDVMLGWKTLHFHLLEYHTNETYLCKFQIFNTLNHYTQKKPTAADTISDFKQAV